MNTSLILSGGTGSRLNSQIPKQYIRINEKMMITRSIEALLKCRLIDHIQIVAAKEWQEEIEKDALTFLPGIFTHAFTGFSSPGETRQLSIYNGLKDISLYCGDEDIVLVHDAARPLVSEKLIRDCLEGCKQHDGVMPALPMKDTLYMSEDGRVISSLLQREKIYAGQAPEAFRLGKYLKATEALFPDRIYDIKGSSEPAILYGMDVAIIEGDERNFKVTTKADLEKYKEICLSEDL
ncbi:MAG: 2-C-methyl-D-erythritol 4-phosphate cytidylyltransferase [Lachnospiraceae bacterium]|nr:2-C-methyl-D-erythritol 4-phosphate cytidylyltransferase [Lachnospiraceae bacterium]